MTAPVTNDGLPPLSERLFALVQEGQLALLDSASRSGNWGDVRSTALAAVCICPRVDSSSRWLQAVQAWILSQQITDGDGAGSWSEEVWDTAMCLFALKEIGLSSRHPSIDTALRWIERMYSINGRGNWHDELWETSWAVMAVLRVGRVLPGVDLAQPITWVWRFQDERGAIIAPHYTAYLLMISWLSLKVELPTDVRKQLRESAVLARGYLLTQLDDSASNKLWTGEAWSNGQVLWALCLASDVGFSPERIEKTVQWFEATQAAEGNWSDTEDTASALLGLLALLRLVLVSQGTKEHEADGEIERRLRRGAPIPQLRVHRSLVERDEETGYLSVHLRESRVRAVVGGVVFLCVVILGWLADVLSLFEVFRAWMTTL